MINFDQGLIQLRGLVSLEKSDLLHQEIDKVTEYICKLLSVDRASVWLYGEEKQSIKCESLYLKNLNEHNRGLVLYRSDFAPYFDALEKDLTIMASDAHTHSATNCFSDSYLGPLGINSMYDVPIWKSDQVIGVLCLEYFKAKNEWCNEERHFIASVADFLAKLYEKLSVLRVAEILEQTVYERTRLLEDSFAKLKEAQDILIEQEKLVGLGTVIAGVAHEIRNPLNLITTSVHVLDEYTSSLNELRENYDDVREVVAILSDASSRLTTIVKDMLDQSVDSNEVSEVDLKELIVYTHKLALQNIAKNKEFVIDSTFDFQVENPRLKVSKQKITRV
jgi:K+-sensing histidine kinase KdpD